MHIREGDDLRRSQVAELEHTIVFNRIVLQIGDEVLIEAWTEFSNMMIQEFVYDACWNYLSPDVSVPRELRQRFNNAFAVILGRCRPLSPIAVIRSLLLDATV
jgi:hypothetical protein